MKRRFVFFVLWYLRIFAKIQIKKIKPLIIGVGGASGKTSLSNFIHIALSDKYKVRQGKGKNSESGIPLDILGIKINSYTTIEWIKIALIIPLKVLTDWEKYDVYIAEMGIDSPIEPKNMTYLLKIIRPKIAVLTNISFEHSVYFDSLIETEDSEKREEEILNMTAKEESLLLTTVSEDGTAILNVDDKIIKGLIPKIAVKKITVSARDGTSDFYIESIKNFVDRFVLDFKFKGQKYKLNINNPLPVHFAYSFMLAIAVAKSCGIEVETATKLLENNFSLPAGRMSVFKGIKNTVIIDSSYNNATLSPILDLLSFVQDIGKQRRRVGIIGDMRELGTMSKTLHEEVAKKILDTLDLVILIGPLSQQYIFPILKKKNFPAFSFQSFTASKNTILETIKPKDMVLVKGSQNTLFLERVVEMLLNDPKDRNKLCRRGEYWDKIREKTL